MTYIERQRNYGPFKFHQLFDLWVEDQGQINYVMMVQDTSSNGHASIQQIPLIFLERQQSYGPDKFCQLFDRRGQMNVIMVFDKPSNCYSHYITTRGQR